MKKSITAKRVNSFPSINAMIAQRAAAAPQNLLFRFLNYTDKDEIREDTITYAVFEQKIKNLAAFLQQMNAAGERALLLYPPGIDYIVAFFGGLYAKVMPVPVYVPMSAKQFVQLKSIADNSGAKFFLTIGMIREIISGMEEFQPLFGHMTLVATDDIDDSLSDQYQEVKIDGNTIAFLQYTSGSTAAPKGVMVSHGNLLYNLSLIQKHFDLNTDHHGVIWLPPYHDMGLIGGIMGPIYGDFPCTLMSPLDFLQKPLRWLQAVTKYKGTTSGGPNFAYDLCVKKITSAQMEHLDLSSWLVAFNGAETIRQSTIDRFSETFAACGFRKRAFYPCYGLAEGTLIVAGGIPGHEPVTGTFSLSGLEKNSAQAPAAPEDATHLVSSGRALDDEEILIVDPSTLATCPPEHVGEIWIAGPGVVRGYWNTPAAQLKATFQALTREGRGPFMRTGDLGFLKEGELFVTGRLKDMMIILGRNIYPHDIELTLSDTHPALRPGCGAAFTITIDQEERVVAVQEVDKKFVQDIDLHKLKKDIKALVSERHGIRLHDLVFLNHGSISKTSSGKIRRHACKIAYLESSLKVLTAEAPASEEDKPAQAPIETAPRQQVDHPNAAAIERWLIQRIATELKVPADQIDAAIPFSDFSLSSLDAMSISGELETYIGKRVPPTLLYDYPTIQLLAEYLSPSGCAEGDEACFTPAAGEDDRIAVIGIGCRFPGGSDTPERFWDFLINGRDGIRDMPSVRGAQFAGGPTSIQYAGVIEDVDKFDAAFFGITPREAEAIDPQHRLLLETAWHALENAGLKPGMLSGSRTGVFVGIANNEYSRIYGEELLATNRYAGTGNAMSIAANRISYLLNLQGPSLSIDTACSSSLVAVHEACNSLNKGECRLALAGGVNLILSPQFSKMLDRVGMLAPDGRCKPFDEAANGYVRGEGCGVVVLKRLQAAIRDHDPIHAVIVGSAVNQDGRSNGLTAPNGPSQEKLIVAAIQRAGIRPHQLGYIEAHGTGTALGDPIEVKALINTVMRDRTNETPCYTGSVKSNIGHLEAAAGIAGLIKAILSLEYGRIAPTLHLKTINPLIPEKEAPRFPLTAQPFPAGDDGAFAGVSSFGFGGTNAHVVVQAWSQAAGAGDHLASAAPCEAIIPLSARDADQLAVYAAAIRDALIRNVKDAAPNQPVFTLADVAHTLQTGREEMPQRLAFVAASVAEIITHLTHFCEQRHGDEDLFQGDTNKEHRRLEWLLGSESGRDRLEEIHAQRDLKRLAYLWASGLKVDWQRLQTTPARKVGLPGYPFKKERHWISVEESTWLAGNGVTHPLLGSIDPARSVNKGLVFNLRLSKEAPLLRDHVVLGRRLLPGAYALEIALAALPIITGSQACVIRHLTWRAALDATDQDAYLSTLVTENQDMLHCEIHSRTGDAEALHAVFDGAPFNSQDGIGHSRPGDLLQNCDRRMTAKDLYEAFKAAGITYGPCFQMLTEVHLGPGQALGIMNITADRFSAKGPYPRYTIFIDGALQTAGALLSASIRDPQLMLPHGIEAATVFAPPPATCYAHVRRIDANRLDAAILDEHGRVCIHLQGIVLRALKSGPKQFFHTPHWVPAETVSAEFANCKTAILCPPASVGLGAALARLHGQAQTLVIELKEPLRETDIQGPMKDIAAQLEGIDTLYFLGGLQGADGDAEVMSVVATAQEYGVLSLFHLLKAMSAAGLLKKELGIKVVTRGLYDVSGDDPIAPLAGGLPGLLKTAVKEYATLRGALIDTDISIPVTAPGDAATTALARRIAAEPVSRTPVDIAIRGTRRYKRELVPLNIPQPQGPVFKTNGVYFILGGTGGIGFELCRYLAREFQAKLIMAGRRARNAAIDAQLDEIKTLGGEGLYCQTDAGKTDSLIHAVRTARQHFGQINGVVHSAIALEDRLIDNMSEAMLQSALAPKVSGTAALYGAFNKEESLDFMLFFSSAQSFLCNAGQSNYAAGCTFKDAYAAYIRKQARYDVHVINWGWWGSVGAVSSPAYRQRMQALGLASIEPAEGMAAIKQVLGQPRFQVAAIKADPAILALMGVDSKHTMDLHPAEIPSLASTVAAASGDFGLSQSKVKHFNAGFQHAKRYVEYLTLHLFQRMGVFQDSSETYSLTALREKLKIDDRYRPLLAALLDILSEGGFITIAEDNTVSAAACLDTAELRETLRQLAQEKQTLLTAYPETKAFLRLVEACTTDYPDLLRGAKSYMAAMFPNGSLELVQDIYTHNEFFDCYNRHLAGIVQNYCKHRCGQDPGATIRILEVGAGTGGTSGFVLEAIQTHAARVRYFYTDVSSGFTQYGKRRFAGKYPFAEFKLLDLEHPETAAFEQNSIDVIIGANVLHATRRISKTLQGLKRLLKHNGLLIVNELTAKQHFATLTFGLTDGWWAFQDPEDRIVGSPLLSREQWHASLSGAGFRNIQAFSLPHEPGRSPRQSIIMAESDGQVIHAEATIHDDAPEASNLPEKAAIPQKEVPATTDPAKRIEAYLVTLFAQVLKINPDQIDVTGTFDEFGVDSLIGLDIMNRMEDDFGALPSTLLFEQLTIRALARYFIEHHKNTVEKITGVDAAVSAAPDEPPQWQPGQTITAVAPAPSIAVTPQPVPVSSAYGIEPAAMRDEYSDIAIIGLSGRYPMADNLEAFWENLKQGKNCIREVPKERWDWRDYYDPQGRQPGKCRSKWGGFMDGVDRFDALFFNISPAEAEGIDPQERLFLETVWHLFEDAGYTRRRLHAAPQPVGLFVGVMNCGYEWLGAAAVAGGTATAARSTFWSIANRASYFFNLHGPSMAVDTACSSSLTALHLACQSIKNGECGMAVAGGVNLILNPMQFVRLSHMKMLAEDDKCRSFGNGGAGFVDGEGVGAVLLKPLARAIAEKDPIYAVIKGSSINTNGKTGGYMVPNPVAQGDLIRATLQKIGIQPESINYIETAANGSPMGDAIEMAGLTRAFKNGNSPRPLCTLGSVKSNIGHLESAAGIAGLTKVVLQMKHRQLVASLHAQDPNPGIDFTQTPFRVQQALTDWEPVTISKNGSKKVYPRRAGISSFGAGGANAHVIVEEYIGPPAAAAASRRHIFPISARDKAGLGLRVEMLLAHLKRYPTDPAQVAYTLQTGREAMARRLAVIAGNTDELVEILAAFRPGVNDGNHLYTGSVAQSGNRAEPLIDGEEGAAFVRQLLANGKLGKIAHLWVSGIEIDWELLYDGDLPARITLPSAPLAGNRHWISGFEVGQPRITTTQAAVPQPQAEKTGTVGNPPAGDAAANHRPAHLDITDEESALHHARHIITGLICRLLALEPGHIDMDTNIFDYGLDSISVARLAEMVSEEYDITVKPFELIDYQTVRQLAQYIVDQNFLAPKTQAASVAATPQTAPPAACLVKAAPLQARCAGFKSDTIFLTGATGVLGSYILRELLLTTESTIYCLVRAGDTHKARQRLKNVLLSYGNPDRLLAKFGQRVVPVIGDITCQNLGLKADAYADLAKNIDMTIHSAALTNLYLPYASIAPINVGGTQHMVDFALSTAQKYILHVSSYSVMGNLLYKGGVVYLEKDFDLGQGFEKMGYPQSKFESERIVREATQLGLQWDIVRPGNIFGDADTGLYPYDKTGVTTFYYEFFELIIKTGLAGFGIFYFDMTPVNYIARGILHLALERETVFETYHLLNPNMKRWYEIINMLIDYGYHNIRFTSLDEYMALIEQNALQYRNDGTGQMIFRLLQYPFVKKLFSTVNFADSQHTKALLEKVGIRCPEIDAKFLDTLLRNYASAGFIALPEESMGTAPENELAVSE